MRILFVMDPLERLDFKWDTSLYLLREFDRRNHKIWTADAGDIQYETKHVFARAKQIEAKSDNTYRLSKPSRHSLTHFDLILIRKEPPFDAAYLYLTYLLELVSDRIAIENHPRGIRNANEKLSILHFPAWIPETLVTNSPAEILAFQKKIKADLVLKPLDEKGGKNVVLLKLKTSHAKNTVQKATQTGKKFILSQRFLQGRGSEGEKRILILNGEILAAYEKRPPRGDFRANIVLGGTAHPTQVTSKEKALVQEMKPYLLKEGLSFVGLDTLANQLLEVNVTCTAGLTDAKNLYPRLGLAEAWADSLERLAIC